MGNKGSFLKHIAGLRAVAIVLILIFHLNGQAWPQGYLGVDVFLVITGYLLFRSAQAAEGAPSLRDTGLFLWRRIQRIAAPMAVLILLTVGIGAVLLRPEDEVFLSCVGYQACLAKANIFLAHEMANYFASDTAFNPLLHLWYLSVALQVYLIFAVAQQGAQRLPRPWGAVFAAIIGAVSLSIWVRGGYSYYATLPRLWEVAAGGLVCILPGTAQKTRLWASVGAGAGLLAILLPGLGLVPASQALVVAGTVLTLRYLPQSHAPNMLNSKPLQWLGSISFSVYLVHLPVIIFWRMWNFGELSLGAQVACSVATLLLGWAFWWAVEKRRFSWWVVLGLWLGALFFCRAARKSEGFVRFISLPTVTWAYYDKWQVCHEEGLYADWDSRINPFWEPFNLLEKRQIIPETPLLTIGDPTGQASSLLMGDSHAMSLYSGMNELMRQEGPGFTGAYLGSIVLPFSGWEFAGWGRKNEGYYFTRQKEEALLKWLASRPAIRSVIISARWGTWYPKVPEFEACLRRFLQALKGAGKQVLLIGPMPEYSANNSLHYQRIAALRGIPLSEISPACSPASYCEQNKHTLPVLRRMQQEGLCTLSSTYCRLCSRANPSAPHGEKKRS